jgi:hypothetical protein
LPVLTVANFFEGVGDVSVQGFILFWGSPKRATFALSSLVVASVVLFPTGSFAEVGFRDDFNSPAVDPNWTSDWGMDFSIHTESFPPFEGQLETPVNGAPAPKGGIGTYAGVEFADGTARVRTTLPEDPSGVGAASIHMGLLGRYQGSTEDANETGVMGSVKTNSLWDPPQIYFHEFDFAPGSCSFGCPGGGSRKAVVIMVDEDENPVDLEGELTMEMTISGSIAQFSVTDSASPTPNFFETTYLLQTDFAQQAGRWGIYTSDPNPQFLPNYPRGSVQLWDDFCAGEGNFCNAGSGGVAGDYNGDGAVGADDYPTWRDNLGSDASAFAVGFVELGDGSRPQNEDTQAEVHEISTGIDLDQPVARERVDNATGQDIWGGYGVAGQARFPRRRRLPAGKHNGIFCRRQALEPDYNHFNRRLRSGLS